MAIESALDPARTAVLSMDMQTAIVSIYAPGDDAFTARAAQVLERCRERGLTVIHVQVGFRPGLPEISPRNALFNAIRTNPQRQQLFQGEGGKIHPAVAPVGEDIVITKHRISAFTGTDIDMILRAKEIDTGHVRHRNRRGSSLHAAGRGGRRLPGDRGQRLLRGPGRRGACGSAEGYRSDVGG